MKIISHRGNLDGPDKLRENNPKFIDECIVKGYDVEIDLRLKNNNLFLGHDFTQYEVSMDWLLQRSQNLWIHAKEFTVLQKLILFKEKLKFFCHETDKFTIVNGGYIWCHDLKSKVDDKCIIPLLSYDQIMNYNQTFFYAVCTDYVYDCEKKFKKGAKNERS
tara:strand:- start:88 stop:573 length:486 start_codon:yes stop_codon:yes gene_type:complete